MFLSPCRAGISHISFLLPSYLDVLWLCSGISTKSSVKPGQKIHLFVTGSFYLFLEIYSHNSIEHDILKDKSAGLTIASPPIQNISKGRGHGEPKQFETGIQTQILCIYCNKNLWDYFSSQYYTILKLNTLLDEQIRNRPNIMMTVFNCLKDIFKITYTLYQVRMFLGTVLQVLVYKIKQCLFVQALFILLY